MDVLNIVMTISDMPPKRNFFSSEDVVVTHGSTAYVSAVDTVTNVMVTDGTLIY